MYTVYMHMLLYSPAVYYSEHNVSQSPGHCMCL